MLSQICIHYTSAIQAHSQDPLLSEQQAMGRISKAKAKASARASLEKSFQSGKRVCQKSPPKVDDGDITKSQRSGFLMYLKSATQSKTDDEKVSVAQILLDEYKTLDAEKKKAMVLQFYRGGAKKQGMEVIYQQLMTHRSSASSATWEGYCTAKMVMKFHEVHAYKERKTHMREPGSSCMFIPKWLESLL